MKKSRLQELAGINPKKGTQRTTALNENFEEEAENLISRQAGTIMTMRQDSDKAAFNMLDQALEKMVADQVEAGYSNDAIHGFFTSLVRDAIEGVEGEKEDQEELQEADAKVIPSAAGGDIQMTVTFERAIEYFNDAAEEMGFQPDTQMPDFEQKLADTMREDLENWLGNNGAQWIEDGMNYDVYDDLENRQ